MDSFNMPQSLFGEPKVIYFGWKQSIIFFVWNTAFSWKTASQVRNLVLLSFLTIWKLAFKISDREEPLSYQHILPARNTFKMIFQKRKLSMNYSYYFLSSFWTINFTADRAHNEFEAFTILLPCAHIFKVFLFAFTPLYPYFLLIQLSFKAPQHLCVISGLYLGSSIT